MNLASLKPNPGAKSKAKRRGRGPGSNLGKTSGRGQNGSGARKSSGIPAGFEGGQQPLQRRVPKRGFRSQFPRDTQIVSIQSLQKKCEGTVTAAELEKAGLIRDASKPVKILGPGKLEKALTVRVNAFSASAKKAIEEAKGVAEVI